MQIELHHGHDEDYAVLSEGDRTMYNFWSVVHSVADQLHRMAENREVEHWPEDALPAATAALMMALLEVVSPVYGNPGKEATVFSESLHSNSLIIPPLTRYQNIFADNNNNSIFTLGLVPPSD